MIAKRRWLALGLAAIAGLAPACSLNIKDGGFTAQGLVVDRGGRPVPGVTVKARNYSTVTDGHGCFLLAEITSPNPHLMPFSVEAAGAKPFSGTVDSPGSVRIRIVLADAKSAADTVLDSSPAPERLLSCEPPPGPPWMDESSAAAASSTRIAALSELPAHLGEYPCRNGLLESPVLTAALQNLLPGAYEKYVENMRPAGCGPLMEHGSWIVFNLSRPYANVLHPNLEGGRTALILVHSQSARVYLFWFPTYWDLKAARIYGPQPVPKDVSTIIVDELTMILGHIATVSWRDGAVQVELRTNRGGR